MNDTRTAPAEPYLYAVIRIVPDIERGERFNVGVVLFCRTRRFLAAQTRLHADKLAALAPSQELDSVQEQLTAMERIAAGDVMSGPLARLDQAERFHWLVAPGSTIVQPSSVHTGLTEDPAATLAHLFRRLVGASGDE
ncbi:MAG: DUF3037 domain-containing protein [Chloroflexota bacterium]|nr:DUF3037 domain-containing protein [Chloroflexota bacterium]